MSTPLLLIAAGGLSREALALVRASRSHEVRGFLDDDPALAGTVLAGLPVLGPLERVTAHPDAEVVLCAGRGAARAALAARLAALGVGPDRYATLVHPLVEVPVTCRIGPGSIVLAQAVLTADVRVGRHVVVMPNATLTHDDVLEDFVTVCAGVSLGGWVHVGARAYLGMNASVRERRRVGHDAVLGMGAALTTDLPSGQTWAGVPAAPLPGVGPAPEAVVRRSDVLT